MKKRIILAISVMFILGLTVAAFALSQSSKLNNTATTTDSCAMKMQSVADGGQAKDSCCDKADCCCKGDACPMKKQGENASASCCSNCCGDSCPMKNKTSETSSVDMKNVTVATGDSCCQKGASCCNGGACCKGKKG